MNELHYSPEAQADLFNIRKYITEELENPAAADNTLRKIIERIRQLSTYPALGAPLSSIATFDTEYRYLVCDNYIAFYYVDGKDVYVVRVLYGRRDYLRVLFGDLPELE